MRSATGRPVRGALLRLIGTEETLGGHAGAALYEPLGVTWSWPLAGLRGTVHAIWKRYVWPEVAGLTWPEYRQLIFVHNPALAESSGRFEAGRTYLLPENRPVASGDVVWDRPLAGFTGALERAWERFVALKVPGLGGYDAFAGAFAEHNPAFAEHGRVLAAGRTYLLPRREAANEYELFTVTNPAGRFSFPGVPAGRYRLVVAAAGHRPCALPIEVKGRKDIAVELPTAWPAQPAGTPGAAAAPAAPSPFVQVIGDEFFLDRRPFRFIGANIRGLVHYGDRQTLQFTLPEHQMRQLQAANDMGAQVVRVFLPSQYRAPADVAVRLRSLLDLIAARFPAIRILPAFTDLYADTPFHVLGDDGLYEDGLLRRRFFESGYRDHYLPFVQSIVTTFKDEPHIFAWEIGNEIKLDRANPADEADPNPPLFIRFVHDVAAAIRQIDTNHLITTGMISTRHAWLFSPVLKRQLYDTPLLDFITVHAYFWNDGGVDKQEDDSPLAIDLHKPFIVEESGFDSRKWPDRAAVVGDDLERWFSRGARGYMPWGFMATEDMGDGDRNVGMDKVFHHDWDGLFGRFQGRAHALAEYTAAWQPENGNVTPPASFTPGQTVYAYDQVRVRRSPGRTNKPAADTLTIVQPGTALTVLGADQSADDLTWWPVRAAIADGTTVEGWCAQTTGDAVLLGIQPPAK